MEPQELITHVRGQLIAVTNICAILLATHPDSEGIMPIIRNLAKAEREGDSAQDKQICAGIISVLSCVEAILSTRAHEPMMSTKDFVKTN